MNENEKQDKIPEVWEGHNVADYIDPDIMKVSCKLLGGALCAPGRCFGLRRLKCCLFQKLEDLEKEEELKERAGEYDSEGDSEDEEMQEIRVLAKQIRQKKQLLVLESREKDVHGPRMPRTATKVRGAQPAPPSDSGTLCGKTRWKKAPPCQLAPLSSSSDAFSSPFV